MVKVKEKTWGAVVDYIEERMAFIRQTRDGKHSRRNNELWLLKKAMQEVDPTITNVGENFHEHEEAGYDTKEGAE